MTDLAGFVLIMSAGALCASVAFALGAIIETMGRDDDGDDDDF